MSSVPTPEGVDPEESADDVDPEDVEESAAVSHETGTRYDALGQVEATPEDLVTWEDDA